MEYPQHRGMGTRCAVVCQNPKPYPYPWYLFWKHCGYSHTHLKPYALLCSCILYDIGCQMHRSIIKWGFLQEFQEHLVFGISVIHAYGHEWTCQLIYNPRKQEGFGLTNGEGCEHLWSVPKDLILNLHISGISRIALYLNYSIKVLTGKL